MCVGGRYGPLNRHLLRIPSHRNMIRGRHVRASGIRNLAFTIGDRLVEMEWSSASVPYYSQCAGPDAREPSKKSWQTLEGPKRPGIYTEVLLQRFAESKMRRSR